MAPNTSTNERVAELTKVTAKRAHALYQSANTGPSLPEEPLAQKARLSCKIKDEYLAHLPPPRKEVASPAQGYLAGVSRPLAITAGPTSTSGSTALIRSTDGPQPSRPPTLPTPTTNMSTAAAAAAVAAASAASETTLADTPIQRIISSLPITQSHEAQTGQVILKAKTSSASASSGPSSEVTRRSRPILRAQRPEWHAPWKLMRVISGHLGWVRALAVEPGNTWFASGAGDRTIKIWDLASGTLKLSLTGHISPVRGLAVSPRHPYLFSAGEDKMVKCWDLEQNKVIRHYHGHLSGIYALALHPTLDVLVTAGRDATARVWDIRTKACVHVLSGHADTITSVQCQEADPQIITGSMDATVRLWDLAAGKTLSQLTHHKKGVRALANHPREFSFASASADNIKQWRCPEGNFLQNFSGHQGIVNALSVNTDNVLFSGGDDGSMRFWDWKSGHCFQSAATTPQPGSLDSEAGIFASTFDRTGLRLITGEADKSIKVWKEDEEATEETHPLEWQPSLLRTRY